ncbi:MAG: serpin family protein [Clostridiales bacterium]|nr:serpin family protein [Clostridiales bacterium]
MKRYQKANEGIHAPEELKENAARPSQKHSHARWMGAVAAVLVVAIIGGIALWPGRTGGPAVLSGDNPGLPIGRSAERPETYSAHALSLAVYPEMHPYPRQDDYFDHYTDHTSKAYDKAYNAWSADMKALRSGTDYTGMLDEFLSASTAQFLTGAGEDNRIYSPLNVYMALSMLAETAGGDSRRQILDLLQVDSIETLRTRAAALWKDHYRDDGTVTSILGSSLWLRDGMTYSQKTLDTLAETYYASSFSGEMGSEEYNQALRDWLNGQTGGLLDEQVSQLEMTPETVMALASTIYFKAAWHSEFNKERTETDVFHAPSGDVDVDFMHKTLEDTYYWGEHFAAVQLSFQQGGSMWLILPDEGYSVDELLQSGEAMDFLLASKYGNWDEKTQKYVGAWPGQKYLDIHLSMPKFDVSSDLDLIEGLKALGVTDVFNMYVSNFDPLGASTDDPLYVAKAQHAARVTVDEDGCEAAAYTVMLLYGGAAPPPNDEVDFTLDRPFLFAVTGDSDLPLFLGVVNQPAG